ncbi:hypothetical protein HS7_16720 [Sulfolobales archaeon HS-7]|nr:hypothetical protein HS7_16720 [Sulfolobales archaeon HS-7]
MVDAFSIISEKVVDVAIKYGCEITVQKDEIISIEGVAMSDMIEAVAKRTGFWLSKKEGSSFFCNICSKGPFTKRGLYLHLSRLHRSEIKRIIEEELKVEVKKFT